MRSQSTHTRHLSSSLLLEAGASMLTGKSTASATITTSAGIQSQLEINSAVWALLQAVLGPGTSCRNSATKVAAAAFTKMSASRTGIIHHRRRLHPLTLEQCDRRRCPALLHWSHGSMSILDQSPNSAEVMDQFSSLTGSLQFGSTVAL